MILYDQTTFSDPEAGTHGDCKRACHRTWLQQAMPDLPHPIGPDGNASLEYNDTLESYGWIERFMIVRPERDYSHLPRVIMASGPTERSERLGGIHHLVILDRIENRLIHDPHPSRAGLTEVKWYWWLEQAPWIAHPDNQAVDRFAYAMKAKLAKGRAKGRGGWEDPAQVSDIALAEHLVEHLSKGNAGTFEDVANFAMMLHQRGADPMTLKTAAEIAQVAAAVEILR